MFPFLRERPCLLIIFPILAIAGFDLLRTNGRLPRRRCRSRKQVDGGTWHHGIMMNMMIFFINIIIMMITMICHNDCNATIPVSRECIQDETCAIYVARGHDNGMPCSKVR